MLESKARNRPAHKKADTTTLGSKCITHPGPNSAIRAQNVGIAGQRLVRHMRHLIKKRIDTPHGQWLQRRRQTVAEGAFGFIKQTLGFQRFSLRGLEKVQTEWQLVCLAFNLRKLA